MEHITIERSKVYPRPARPGFAWSWVYTVTVPGQPHTFSGSPLSWARKLAKKHAAEGQPILEKWSK
jgi:hypothetical protein